MPPSVIRSGLDSGAASAGPFRTIAAAAQGDPLERYLAYLTRYLITLAAADAHFVAALDATGPPLELRTVVAHAGERVGPLDTAAVEARYRAVEAADPFHPARWDQTRALLIGTREVSDQLAGPNRRYVEEFLEPLGFGSQLALYLRDRLRVVGFVVLLRAHGEPDFDAADRRALLHVQPIAQYSLAMARRVDHATSGSGRAPATAMVTAREREVLGLLSSGASNEAIARALSLSPETVKTHLSRLYRKFGVHNRTELVMRVIDEL